MPIGAGGGRGRSKTGDAIEKRRQYHKPFKYVKDPSGVEVSPVLHGVPGSPDLHLCITQLAPLYKADLLRAEGLSKGTELRARRRHLPLAEQEGVSGEPYSEGALSISHFK